MKKNYLYILMITCIALFASCRDDKEYTYEPAKNIIFNGSLPQETRVNATTWDKDDQVGIYMIGSLASFDVLDGADNKKFHTPNGDGVFWHYDNLNTVRFPEGRGQVDFVSYYPYQSDIKDLKYLLNISDQSNQSAIDLLYSSNATGVTKDVVPSLIFDHKLTKLVFNITGTGGLTDLEGLKVTLSALPTKGFFNLADGTLAVQEISGDDVVMKTTIDSKDLLKAVGEGIVIPTSAAKRVLSFTLNVDGAPKKFDVDASTYVFEAGKKNKYDVTLDAKLGAIIRPTSTITPWEDGSSEVIDVDISGGDKDGKETVIFTETFGAGAKDAANKWITVADYQDYSAKNMTYTDPYGTASSIRNLNGVANIWLPANKDSGLKIEGIPANQKGLVLTYEILSNSKTDIKTADIIQVKANDALVTVPTTELSFENWTTVTLNLPDNTTNIEFYSATALNTVGIRVANIKLIAKGGSTPEVPVTKGIIFTETFGAGAKDAANKWIKVDAYADYTAKNVTYSDPYTGKWADIRNLKEVANVWFPAFATDKESGFKIEGIASGYSEMQLEYQMLGQNPTTSDIIQLKCNGTIVDVTSVAVNNATWSTVTVDIPNNTTSIEFYSGSANTVGVRIANIKLQGAK